MNNIGQRQRSKCVIGVDPKKTQSTTNIVEESKETKQKENIEGKKNAQSFIMADQKVIRKQRESLKDSDFDFNFQKPKFSGVKKEYYTTKPKNIFFHEKGSVVTDFDKSNVEFIESNFQKMDIKDFFSNYSEKDIDKLELTNLLDIDYEKLEELKEKALEFIDASSLLIQEKKNDNLNTDEEEELSMFFLKKLEEIIGNKLNIQIFINNIEKVQSLAYSNNGIKVYFKKKK